MAQNCPNGPPVGLFFDCIFDNTKVQPYKNQFEEQVNYKEEK